MSQIDRQQLFGTDGIRGTPGEYPLTNGMLSKIATGISHFVFAKKTASKKMRVVIGKDTRLSGEQIEIILAETFTFHGIDVDLVGIITTPGLAYLTHNFKADIGVMISASHNKAQDNGIKFFNSRGCKLSLEEEEQIEDIIFKSLVDKTIDYCRKQHGKIQRVKDAQIKYTKFLSSTLEGKDLKGVRIALDCAFGAASGFARQLFEKSGAKVFSINDTPNGDSINIGGAIDPSFIKALVLKTKSDIGVAVDGDGDRGILVDETGHVLDGDYTMAIIARYLLKEKKLTHDTLVTTVMSNYGLKAALSDLGGKIITANVGDKFVLEALLNNNLKFGGEQSGHIIFLDYLSTPDGLLTALQVLKVMRETKKTLSELSKCLTKYPQVLINIKVKERRPFEDMPAVAEKLQDFNNRLKDQGRILLRYSGTEALARVMVEGFDKDLIENIANSLADEIRQEIGVD
jgi:phosphoglucosamine mutase